jgi:two-component system chemotaxis response regulator CheY
MVKILVVDDAAFMRMRCTRVLTDGGFEVVEAVDGEQGVAQFQATHPDVVLLDVTMPKMDGLTALKAIRKIDPEARVAMVTAMAQQGVVVEALKSGAKDFVVKPFEPDRLLAAVNRILA